MVVVVDVVVDVVDVSTVVVDVAGWMVVDVVPAAGIDVGTGDGVMVVVGAWVDGTGESVEGGEVAGSLVAGGSGVGASVVGGSVVGGCVAGDSVVAGMVVVGWSAFVDDGTEDAIETNDHPRTAESETATATGARVARLVEAWFRGIVVVGSFGRCW